MLCSYCNMSTVVTVSSHIFRSATLAEVNIPPSIVKGQFALLQKVPVNPPSEVPPGFPQDFRLPVAGFIVAR